MVNVIYTYFFVGAVALLFTLLHVVGRIVFLPAVVFNFVVAHVDRNLMARGRRMRAKMVAATALGRRPRARTVAAMVYLIKKI